jgi:hypothetical protein
LIQYKLSKPDPAVFEGQCATEWLAASLRRRYSLSSDQARSFLCSLLQLLYSNRRTVLTNFMTWFESVIIQPVATKNLPDGSQFDVLFGFVKDAMSHLKGWDQPIYLLSSNFDDEIYGWPEGKNRGDGGETIWDIFKETVGEKTAETVARILTHYGLDWTGIHQSGDKERFARGVFTCLRIQEEVHKRGCMRVCQYTLLSFRRSIARAFKDVTAQPGHLLFCFNTTLPWLLSSTGVQPLLLIFT